MVLVWIEEYVWTPVMLMQGRMDKTEIDKKESGFKWQDFFFQYFGSNNSQSYARLPTSSGKF